MANILEAWRKSAGKSVKEAAAAAKVTPPMWSRWENGKRRVPGERAVKIEKEIGIPKWALRPDLFSRTEAAE